MQLIMTRASVQVLFKLNKLPTTVTEALKDDIGLKLGITGSIPELGSSKVYGMVTAEPSGVDPNVWGVASDLPVGARFEWKWAIIARDGRIICSDPAGYRQTILNSFSGVVETRWGLSETYFRSMTAAVKMRIHHHCRPDEVMAVTGSEISLGSWDPKKAIRAKQSPENSHNWISEVLLDVTFDKYEWKWVVLDSYTGVVRRWEEGPNRQLQPEGCHHPVVDTSWNNESVSQHRAGPVVSGGSNASKKDTTSKKNQTTDSGDEDVTINWLNNANCLELPFEVTDRKLAVMEAAARAAEPARRSLIRRLGSAILPFVELIRDWWNWVE